MNQNENILIKESLHFSSNENLPLTTGRLSSIDLLRGIVMVLMALDHVRDFFTNVSYNPLDLEKASVGLFLTRWITHYCAPIFIFLAGISAFLYGSKVKDKKQLFLFLLTRGIWLVFLELTIVRFGWLFNFDYSFLIAQVIWAIGWSMIILSVLVFLPNKVVGFLGFLMIVLHNLLDPIKAESMGSFASLWKILHQPGMVEIKAGVNIYIAYPLIPWIGLMAVGFWFGNFFLITSEERKPLLIKAGSILIIIFIGLRFFNIYGDASIWISQKNSMYTILSFINTTKYPPSLLYICMTIGPALILLTLLENTRGSLSNFFIIIGKVPLFYYILHLPLIHGLAVLNSFLHGKDISSLFSNDAVWDVNKRIGYGLPGVYLTWIIVVVLLYPLCYWFANFKKKNKEWKWLSYL